MTAVTREVEEAKRTGSFRPASSGWRRACRLFPGFAALPPPVLVSLERYAELVEAPAGPLHARDREAIAAAVVAIVTGGAVEARAAAAHSGRGVALACFASRLIAATDLDRTDLDRLVRSGFTADEVRAAAETAIGFHVVARLAHAASGRQRSLASVPPAGNPVAAMCETEGGQPVRAA